jgi:hypothetical protein
MKLPTSMVHGEWFARLWIFAHPPGFAQVPKSPKSREIPGTVATTPSPRHLAETLFGKGLSDGTGNRTQDQDRDRF